MPMMFRDRHEAGEMLARRLSAYKGRSDVVVVGLPRGGVPVAYEVAKELRLPLDVFIVRKLGVPGYNELAMGAIAPGGVITFNQGLIKFLHLPMRVLEQVVDRESRELERREKAYRDNHPRLDVRGRTVIVVDDGLATGSTMRAAIAALRQMHPALIVVAAPVGASSICKEIAYEADECVCLITPEPFYSVGAWYEDFTQTTDNEVRDLLERVALRLAPTTIKKVAI